MRCFPVWRYHPLFTNTDEPTAAADITHRRHAVIETVFADLIDGSWAHLPCAAFHANAAWVQLAATAHAMTRALGVLASTRHARARGTTIRAELVQVAARPARSGRDTITWHLPENWPWQHAWLNAFDATHRPPPAQAA